MQFNCDPLRSKPPERILYTSLQRVPRRRRVSTLAGYLSTASFFADLHHAGFISGGRFRPAHIGTATKQIGENAACSARARLETAQQVHWSRLKIATNVVGVICSSNPRQPLAVLSQRKQRQCVLMGRSGYQQRSAWDLVQLRAWTGPMEKMPHRGEGPIWHHTAERRPEFCCVRHPLSHRNLS
jgi:hypothetical protein